LDGSRAEVVASAGRFLDHPEKLEELVVEGIELEDGRAALVTARVETDRGPLAALLEVVVTSECPPAPRYMFGSFQYERRTADSHAGSPPPSRRGWRRAASNPDSGTVKAARSRG